jgi:Ca-activated chloride channel family protein
MMARRSFAFVFASVAGFCLFAQQDPLIRHDVSMVLLDVGVTNHAGHFIPGLAKENFTIFEDGKPQPITAFDNSDIPVTQGILVDESQSMGPKRVAVLTAAEALVKEANPHDDFFVLNFNEQVKRGLPPAVPFSASIQQLRQALYRGLPQGKTALYDAVIEGLKQLEGSHRGRKVLVVISDGGDNASHHKRPEMLNALERSGATVYGIGFYTEGDPEIDPGVLKQIAHTTGGEALFPSDPAAVTAACERIAKEIRARYVVGYRPPEGTAGALRHIRVRVSPPRGEGVTVLVRSSYRYGSNTDNEAAGTTNAPTR